MDSEFERQLEREIDRELKNLPEWSAPASLIGDVLSTIARRSVLPWYRQAWQEWPRPAQAISLLLLTVLFGAICAGAGELWQLRGVIFARSGLNEWFAPIIVAWNAATILAATALAVIRNLGPAVLIGCGAVAAFNYFACVGLGTVVVRFAFSRINVNRQST